MNILSKYSTVAVAHALKEYKLLKLMQTNVLMLFIYYFLLLFMMYIGLFYKCLVYIWSHKSVVYILLMLTNNILLADK